MYKLTIKFKNGNQSTIMYVADSLKNKVVHELLANSGITSTSEVCFASVINHKVVETYTNGEQQELEFENIIDYIKNQEESEIVYFYVNGETAFYTPNVLSVKAQR